MIPIPEACVAPDSERTLELEEWSGGIEVEVQSSPFKVMPATSIFARIHLFMSRNQVEMFTQSVTQHSIQHSN